MFYWFETILPFLYLDPLANFSETIEKPGFFAGFVDNEGDVLTFKILKDYLGTVLYRSVVRSAENPIHRNKRVTFKSDVQETLEKLDSIPGAKTRSDNQPKQRSRKPNDEVSNRTRSKIGNINQNVGDRTRSKVHAAYNSDMQDDFFPLYDAFNFKKK
jgi:hypothetical protein